MHIALYTGREVIIDYLPYTLKVHTSSHDFRADHHPTLAFAHSAHGVLSLFLAHPCMEAIHVGDTVQDEFLREGRRTRLGGREDKDRWVVRLCKVGKESGKFGLVVRDVCEGLGNKGERSIPA